MSQKLIEIAKVFQTPLRLNAKAGDTILIMTDTQMDPLLWQGLATAANGLDMEPVVTIMTPRAHHAANPASPAMQAALDPKVDLVIYLTSTAMAHAKITEDLVDAGKKFILMEELTVDMLKPGGPAWADYEAMNRLGLKIAEVYSKGKTVRVTCPNGTDLTVDITGRPGRSIAGMPLALHPGKGGGCAFPDGEAHVCPVEGTGEGRVVFDLTAHSVGSLKEPMILTVEKGMVTKIEGGYQAQIWRQLLERAGDTGSYNCPAEVSIGLNKNVVPTGSMRTDKKMYATSHIGVGDTIVLGGTCHAKLRLEGVIRYPEISVDGQVLTRAGRILLDD
ncbi:MAG: aminopeptidase [Ramlibacter sp.]|uniref:aminopeptidase n=1 Tax=Ramlibacter sp. TaxID=1917967 RepID=UPI00261F07B1|nr:aminopeptidase [Ramlibacter sp.]MDH4377524.1 aminopeptidase [Ramlibacter sp.]